MREIIVYVIKLLRGGAVAEGERRMRVNPVQFAVIV